MRHVSIALVIVLALATQVCLAAAQTGTAHSMRALAAAKPVPKGDAPDPVLLYAQSGGTLFGAQVLRDAEQAAFDSEAADDFTVTNAEGWTVTNVLMLVNFNNVANLRLPSPGQFDVMIRLNNDGAPGAELCSYTEIPAEYTLPNNGFSSAYIALPDPCELGVGTYWLSITPVYNRSQVRGQSFWSMSPGSVIGLPSMWRNPGGGYNSTCGDFEDVTTCVGDRVGPIGAGFSNLGFLIYGIKIPPLCSDVIFADGYDGIPPECTPG